MGREVGKEVCITHERNDSSCGLPIAVVRSCLVVVGGCGAMQAAQGRAVRSRPQQSAANDRIVQRDSHAKSWNFAVPVAPRSTILHGACHTLHATHALLRVSRRYMLVYCRTGEALGEQPLPPRLLKEVSDENASFEVCRSVATMVATNNTS